MKKERKRYVIDVDINNILETFNRNESEKIELKYINLELWEDVEFDSEGDLILCDSL